MSEKRIYLDVCALCRPFDDQQQARIRLESNAVELILANIRKSDVALIISPTHNLEISAIRLHHERQYLLLLLDELGTSSEFNLPIIRQRAEALAKEGALVFVSTKSELSFPRRRESTGEDRFLPSQE